ncbi:MAG: hypothetical protein KGL34_05575 [Gammaproteobacteria bacterium]|nr:hypothetical protein [Gammaproteobacteria bacterium]
MKKARANQPIGRLPGPHAIETFAYYCCAAEAPVEAAGAAAAEAASLAALAAAPASLAAELAAVAAAPASLAAGAVAVVSAGAGASVFLPQAVRTKAAAIALRTSLVFIYRYPKMIFDV